MRGFLLGIVFTLIVLVAGGWWSVKQGYIDFAADQKPSMVEDKVAMAAVDASTDRRAANAKNPLEATEVNITAGAQLYLDHCAGCHGLPSSPDSQFARSFNPPVPEFFKDAPDMTDGQNFYMIQHGVRWTGMPAWGRTLSETQIWQLATFLGNTEKLPPAAQKRLESQGSTPAPSMQMTMPPAMKMDR